MTPDQIKQIAFKNLEGHLRSIAGTMTIEDLVGDRTKLNAAVLNDAAKDLDKLGLGIDLLTIQEISDRMGYIEQLGKKRTAEVVRDAQIGQATAQKESTVLTTTAQKDGALKANENTVLIADSERERDVKKAQFSAKVAAETATAAQAGPLADANAKKAVVIAQQEVKRADTEKATEVAEAQAKKREKELVAEVIKPAEAAKLALIIEAEARKQARIIDAEGEQQAIQMIAEANKQKLAKEGEGQAIAIKATMLAEADGKQAGLLAEAAGILKKAEAYEKLDQTGKLLQVLEVIERVLPGAIKEFAGVMKAAADPIGNIKEVKVIDFGGNSNGGSSVGKFGKLAPEMIAKVLAGLSGSGIDVNDLLAKVGINAEELLGAKKTEAASEAPEENFSRPETGKEKDKKK
jgi:flotillin